MVIGRFTPAWLRRYRLGAAVAVALLLGGLVLFRARERGGDSPAAADLAAEEAAIALLDGYRPEAAEDTCRRALVALDGQIARQPHFRELRRRRADLLYTIGRIQDARDQHRAAEANHRHAIAEWATLVAEEPESVDDRLRMAECLDRRGLSFRDAGRWDESEEYYQRCRRLCEQLPIKVSNDARLGRQLAVVREQYALLLLDMARCADAVDAYAGAVEAQRAAVRNLATGNGESGTLVSLLIDQARALIAARRSGDAERALTEAVGLAQSLHTRFPADPVYQDLEATALRDLAKLIQVAPERAAQARELLERARVCQEKLVVTSGHSPPAQAKLASINVSLARLVRDQESVRDAEKLYRNGLVQYSHLTRDDPNEIVYQLGYGEALDELADLLRESGRVQEALPLARQSVERLAAVYAENRTEPEYRAAISHAYWTLCAVEIGLEDHRQAADAVREYLQIEPCGFEEALESARFLCRCVDLARADQALPPAPRVPIVRTYSDRALEALRLAIHRGFQSGRDLETTPIYEPLRGRADFRSLLIEVRAREAASQDG